ncbi:MAG: D-alanine--D-alanine ligase [Verrucomicrobiaceae bacterium]|nr:D-alanine--D-alanine ligase [Verrucomicrobiaceae bacterium]
MLQLNLKGKVAVLYGGNSAEREVSLESGGAVFAALQKNNVPAVLVDTKNSNWWRDVGSEFAHAFIALHGRGGEDGTVQGLLQTLGVSYTGSGVMASALAMDKLRTKQLWAGIGLPSPEFEVLTAHSDFADIISRFGMVMVKPVHEGSSVGMAKASNAAQLEQAFVTANQFDALVIAERCIQGAEFTVAVLGDTALPAIRLETDNVFYDYEAKYISNDTRYICPCGLSDKKNKELSALGLAAFKSVGCAGWGRADVMQDGDGKFYLLEVNTVPGMTSHSLVPMAARAAGLEFDQLVVEILRLSLEAKR